MRDTVATGTAAGIIGTILLFALTIVARFIGVQTSTPWDVAALVFLEARFLGTIYAYIIGIAGATALSVATGILTAALIRLTGSDYAMLKGVLVAEALGFGSLGFFIPMVIGGMSLRDEPVSNIFAMINLLIFGLVVGYYIKRYANFAKTDNSG